MGETFDYNALDAFKREAQHAARRTARHLPGMGFSEIEESRGESAYLVDIGSMIIAHVEEGLGTKNLVAEAMQFEGHDSYLDFIAHDTVAMIVNDLITVGALPVSVAMHLAVGSNDWFSRGDRVERLIEGWENACNLAGCAWGPGETPTLRDVILPETAVFAGSAWGVVNPKNALMLGSKIRPGDAIVLLESSGIHANGLTLARKIAAKAPEGYHTLIEENLSLGAALLKPTHLYASIIAECQSRGIDLHYGVNITGHGWRKLMRAPQPFAYLIDAIPDPQTIFRFIQRETGNSDREMYGDYNMGAGFALYLPRNDVPDLFEVVHDLNLPYDVLIAGTVEQSETRSVSILPLDIEFTEEDLRVR